MGLFCLCERMTEGERLNYWFIPKMATKSGTEQGESQEPEVPSGSSTLLAETQKLFSQAH